MGCTGCVGCWCVLTEEGRGAAGCEFDGVGTCGVRGCGTAGVVGVGDAFEGPLCRTASTWVGAGVTTAEGLGDGVGRAGTVTTPDPGRSSGSEGRPTARWAAEPRHSESPAPTTVAAPSAATKASASTAYQPVEGNDRRMCTSVLPRDVAKHSVSV